MSKPSSLRDLHATLEEALSMLRNYTSDDIGEGGEVSDQTPLPSLLAQCEAMCADTPTPNAIRSIHHFACSGGTLISKFLSTMPNVTLLSEIDPLSLMQIKAPQARLMFHPTDLIHSSRVALRPIDDATAEAMFHTALEALHSALSDTGRHLVLRDHAHSQFCSDTAPPDRPTLHDLLTEAWPVLSIVTVRHPLDCYLSLNKNNWKHFSPFTLDEYARRHIAFLDRHRDLPVFYYEDFVDDPDRQLEAMCAALRLPFMPGAEAVIKVVGLSGGSGRSSAQVARRPRRQVSDAIATEIDESAAYAALCSRLRYAVQGEAVTCGPIDQSSAPAP